MTATFDLVLDSTAPAGVAASIDSGATYSTDRDVSLAITTTDPDTTGYQVKIWGDVDLADNANIQGTEGASTWISLATPHAVKISTGDGTKTLTVRIRDDVWNESSTASDTIILDTTAPTVDWTAGPTPSKISKVSGKRTSDATFTPNNDISAWKVKVVPSTGSLHSAGTTIPTTNGSTGMTGGALTASTPQAVQIDGRDLEAADAGDGTKHVKVFVQDAAGNWST